MKKVVLSIVTFLVVIVISGYGVYKSVHNVPQPPDVTLSNIEALASGESGSSFCHSGGPGATMCSISGGIKILGYGVTSGCSVSCGSDYYACCSLRCTCVKKSGESEGSNIKNPWYDYEWYDW